MNETIRDYIKRRVRWCMAVGIGGWLVFALGGVVAAQFSNPIIVILGFLMFGGAVLALQRIKCPKCSGKLGQTVAMPIGLRMSGPQVNFCPYCGVSLDEPRAQGTPVTQPTSLNPIK